MGFVKYVFIRLLLLIVLFLLYWKFWFCRDPERAIPRGRLMVAPADGRIIDVYQFRKKHQKIKKGLLGQISTFASDVADTGYIISIFMSPIDVHFNRAPVAGKILSVKHTKGKFLPANNPRSTIENEKAEILMKNDALGKIKLIQLAGFCVRRIDTYVKAGDTVKKGEKVGFINLGSQLTLIVPKKMRISVKKGDKVKAGTSIIGEY